MICKAVVLAAALALGRGEVISDLVTSTVDESSALKLKANKFWQSVLSAAEEMKLAEHLALCSEAEKVLASLPAENSYVKQALQESVERLRRADKVVLSQAADSSKIAADRLAGAPRESSWSFISAGQDFLSSAFRSFVDGSDYSRKLADQVSERQADILPVLRGVASATGDVLGDCRLASQRAFDVLKYDLYNKGVPKTPADAKAVAHRLADAAGETRHRFVRFVTEAVSGITRDVEGKRESASATMLRSAVPPAATTTAAARSPGRDMPELAYSF